MPILDMLRKRSHVRLFFIFICTLVIPLIILTSIFLQFYQEFYSKEVTQSICSEVNSISINMDTQCQTAATYISTISRDSDLREYLLAAQNPDYDLPDRIPSLRSVIYRYMSGKPSLLNSQVIILTAEGEAIFNGSQLGALKDGRMLYEMVRQSTISPLKSTYWFYEQQMRDVANDDAYIYIVRPVTDSANWQNIGYVVLRFRNSDFISMYLSSTRQRQSMFVLDRTGEIISSIDNLGAREIISGDQGEQLRISTVPVSLDNDLIYTVQLSNLWYLASVTDTHVTTQPQLKATITLYFGALLACAVLTLFVAYNLSKRFMRPVNILISRMQEVEQGNLQSRAVIQSHDEFAELANSYNKMIQRIEDLMHQIFIEQEEKRKSDIKMLQAQINPHFMYNTLASLRYMVYSNPPEEVDKMLLALSRFLKYVLSNSETIYVTLDREFEQLRNYATIQQNGFEVVPEYSVEIEEGLGHYHVVKMLFQPLIENAFLHGLKLNHVDPKLHIRVYSVEGDLIRVDIIDNGHGFDMAALSDQEHRNEKPLSHHLGVANVRQRLRLHYGERGQLDIRSEIGVGTTASITVPKLTEEDMNRENLNR